MEVKLSEEQVAEAVTAAITKSVLGEQLQKAITEAVDKAISGQFYGANVVQQVVNEVMRGAVVKIVAERREEIEVRVGQLLAADKLDEFVTALYTHAMRDI